MTIEGWHNPEENVHEPLDNGVNGAEGANFDITPQDAETNATLVVESVGAKDDIQMLNDIIKAFNDDKHGNLASLRIEYNALTDKIMRSYNAEIKKVIENRNNNSVEDMRSKESTKLWVESEEKSGDFSESAVDGIGEIIAINNDPNLAKLLSDNNMKAQPEEVLGEISDINEVLEKGSEENKKILRKTISEVQGTITHLYYAAGLDKRVGEENLKRAA